MKSVKSFLWLFLVAVVGFIAGVSVNAAQAKQTPSPAVQEMQYGGVQYERKYVNGKYYVVFIYGDDMEVVKE